MTLAALDWELKRYGDYLRNVKIPLLSAVKFGFHKYAYDELVVPNALWETQIPSFEEFKVLEDEKGWGARGKQSYLTVPIY